MLGTRCFYRTSALIRNDLDISFVQNLNKRIVKIKRKILVQPVKFKYSAEGFFLYKFEKLEGLRYLGPELQEECCHG